ncbi:MAG: alginate export family protein, partial [Candidatus Marinimicrobia bacterium]|nr:alginate export family protein [Candidatus Neomarinimicrobiota bacterium]
YIQATSEIKSDTGEGSQDLGMEVDFRLKHNIQKNLFLMLRGGYFIPGDAAGYLINGHKNTLDPAYELKGMVVYKF